MGDKINKDDDVGDLLKLVFIPDYNVSIAEVVIPGSELSQHISTAGESPERGGVGGVEGGREGQDGPSEPDEADFIPCQDHTLCTWFSLFSNAMSPRGPAFQLMHTVTSLFPHRY